MSIHLNGDAWTVVILAVLAALVLLARAVGRRRGSR